MAARDRHLQRFVCEQPPYSMLVRGTEAEVLPTCARYGMGVISWSPLAGGWLSGRYRQDADQTTPFSAAAGASPSASTCRCLPTSASSRRPKPSPSWPRRPGCR